MLQLLILAQAGGTAQGSVASEVFFGLSEDERFVVILVAIGCGTGVIIAVTALVSNVISSVHRRNAEYELKREMLDRGMSAEEISQVIETAPQPEDGVERWIASWGKCRKRSC